MWEVWRGEEWRGECESREGRAPYQRAMRQSVKKYDRYADAEH